MGAEQNWEKMNLAAGDAQLALLKLDVDEVELNKVKDWFYTWYRYAGYKRLVKVFLGIESFVEKV